MKRFIVTLIWALLIAAVVGFCAGLRDREPCKRSTYPHTQFDPPERCERTGARVIWPTPIYRRRVYHV